MAVRRSRLIFILSTLLVSIALLSCVKVRGPGIMPPVRDDGYGQWEVLSSGFDMVRADSGQAQWKWQIIARFIPEEGSGGIGPLDLTAQVDGVQVPFTFEEKGQLFESVTTHALAPGSHWFELAPSDDSSLHFPILTVDFQAP